MGRIRDRCERKSDSFSLESYFRPGKPTGQETKAEEQGSPRRCDVVASKQEEDKLTSGGNSYHRDECESDGFPNSHTLFNERGPLAGPLEDYLREGVVW